MNFKGFNLKYSSIKVDYINDFNHQHFSKTQCNEKVSHLY